MNSLSEHLTNQSLAFAGRRHAPGMSAVVTDGPYIATNVDKCYWETIVAAGQNQPERLRQRCPASGRQHPPERLRVPPRQLRHVSQDRLRAHSSPRCSSLDGPRTARLPALLASPPARPRRRRVLRSHVIDRPRPGAVDRLLPHRRPRQNPQVEGVSSAASRPAPSNSARVSDHPADARRGVLVGVELIPSIRS
jgi:hypothetical protein